MVLTKKFDNDILLFRNRFAARFEFIKRFNVIYQINTATSKGLISNIYNFR